MRGKAALFNVLAIISYIIAVFMHILIIIALYMASVRLSKFPERVYPFWPLIVGIVLLTIGMAGYLFTRYTWSSFAVIAVAAVMLAIIGFDMMRFYPPTVISGGHIAGYDSTWKLVYRHMFPLFTAVFALVRIIYQKRWEEKAAMEQIKQSIIESVAKDGPVFKDENR